MTAMQRLLSVRTSLVLAAGIAFVAATPASAQPLAGWAGTIRCEMQSNAQGYSHQETQTWTLTGGAPAVQGSVTVYPATWSVSGQGWHDRTRNTNRRVAEWTVNLPGANPPVSAPIGFTRHAVGGQFDVAKWHAQLTASGGYTGTDQYINDGVPQTPGRLVMTVYEWQFPKIEAIVTETQLTGSRTTEVRAFVGPLQPSEAQSIVTCTWALGRGSVPPLSPASLPPQAPPPLSDGAVSGGAPPGGGPSGSVPATAPPPAASPAAPVAAATPPPALPTAPSAAPAAPPVAAVPPVAAAVPPPSATTNSPPAATAPGPTASIAPAPQVDTTSPSPSTGRQQPSGTGIAVGGGTVTGTNTPFGTLTAAPGGAPSATGVTPDTARDPANFAARQTADGTVLLTWDAVQGAGSYLVGGPGLNVGVPVSGTSYTVAALPPGAHTWTVATMYNPGGILTTADKWSRAAATIVNRSGRYRVMLTGFRVHRATFDERVNGNGDEVYASAAITTLDRTTDAVLQARTVMRSATYGDVGRDPQRIRAGSFTPTGGLWATDVVPGGDPRAASGPPSPTRFPLALWEGTLRDGVEAVVINPVLWEEDGQPTYYNEWADPNLGLRRQAGRAAAQANAIKDRATRADLTPFRGSLILICSSASDLIPDCSPGNDRPVGISRQGCTGDTFASNLLAWCELTVVLTREGIENALASPQVGGAPSGTIAIPLVEPSGVDPVKGGLDGSYEMYLRVERVP